ncbi:MAG: DNA-protecting protein DprA [Clostridia bacterium]|nr:DNA-protecting protein DprA [Clostridia bacterium]
MQERDYLVGLKHIPGMGAKTINLLVQYFGSAQHLWHVSEKELRQHPQLTDNFIEKFFYHRKGLNLEEILASLANKGIKTVTVLDEHYPINLRQIYDPPLVLFYQGEWSKVDAQALGIVGSRKATVYGQKVAEKLGRELAQAGFVIVSGMARGIDSHAHRGCLEVDGRTIGVLGSGLDVIYPRENYKLAEQIKANGVLLTEYIPGTAPIAGNFPARNRIIAGLSLGVIVVEAAIKSGALITADFALEAGRDVFAVPGPISSPNSKGTHHLIKQGAKLVDQVGDILEEYRVVEDAAETEIQGTMFNLTDDEQAIYDVLSLTPLRVEELAHITRWAPGKIQTVLSLLELHGLIEQLPGRQFIRKSL